MGSIYEILLPLLLTLGIFNFVALLLKRKNEKCCTLQNKKINSQSFEPLVAILRQQSLPLYRVQSPLEIPIPSFLVTTGASSQFIETGSIG